MPPKPTKHFSPSANTLNTLLQTKYPLSQNTACALLKAGINDAYLVTDGDSKYVCRVYCLNWRTQEEINAEISLLLLLKQNDISIAYPIPDNQGHYIQTLHTAEGNRYAVLFSYAAGEKNSRVSVETHYQIGQLMAKMHLLTQNKTLNRIHYTPDAIFTDALPQLSTFLSDDSAEMNFMRATQQQLLQTLASVDVSQLRNGIVHLDMWYDNMHITADNHITLFDFDFCGNGWLCLDIAYYILQLHNTEQYILADYQPKVNSFLQGYTSVAPISTEEMRLIPALGVSLYFFYLGIQCQRYHNWSHTFLNENYLKRYINELVKRYFEIYQ